MKKNSNKQLAGINKQIACDLKRARLLAGLTQKDLAAALGVTYQQIQKYENGTSQISVARFWQLTNLMDLSRPEIQSAENRTLPPAIDDQTLKLCSRIMSVEDPVFRDKITKAVYCLTG